MKSEKLSRRWFLTTLVRGAVATSFFPVTGFGNAIADHNPVNDRFSFADQDGVGSNPGAEIFNNQYFPLHQEKILPLYMLDKNDYRNTISLLKKMYAREGKQWKESSKVLWTFQHYGVSDLSSHSDKLLKYCLSVQDYIYSIVPGVIKEGITWDLLKKVTIDLKAGNAGFRGFVGKNTYLVYRVNMTDEEGFVMEPGIVNVMPVDRAIHFIRSNSHNVPTSSTIYVIHGATSLVAPFSELIHLVTNEPSLSYTDKLLASLSKEDAHRLGRIYGETITEAAGITLASDYMRKYGSAERLDTISNNLQNLSNRFPLLNNVVNYMHQHGVRRTLYNYIENPDQLIKKIKVTTNI